MADDLFNTLMLRHLPFKRSEKARLTSIFGEDPMVISSRIEEFLLNQELEQMMEDSEITGGGRHPGREHGQHFRTDLAHREDQGFPHRTGPEDQRVPGCGMAPEMPGRVGAYPERIQLFRHPQTTAPYRVHHQTRTRGLPARPHRADAGPHPLRFTYPAVP
ncbi:MAG: hypothetical protein MZV64_11630 [Ignavibacteriales bacterium]|nr:hypothetical protein [Ignavibacteriales bacterium]